MKKYKKEKKQKDCIVVNGIIEKALPNAQFNVRLEDDRIIIAHICGKIRTNHITILQGDRVKVEFGLYDLTRGRIIFRC